MPLIAKHIRGPHGDRIFVSSLSACAAGEYRTVLILEPFNQDVGANAFQGYVCLQCRTRPWVLLALYYIQLCINLDTMDATVNIKLIGGRCMGVERLANVRF